MISISGFCWNFEGIAYPAIDALTRDGLELEDQQEIENTFINLDYDHPSSFLNSKVHAQIYYRDYLTRYLT